jgi:hypothetical protein
MMFGLLIAAFISGILHAHHSVRRLTQNKLPKAVLLGVHSRSDSV